MSFVTDTDHSNNAIASAVSALVLLLLLLFCCKPRPRRLSDEELEEQEKQNRLEDPNYRKCLINRALIVKQVTGADPEQGRLTLDEVQQEQEHVSLGDVSSPSKQLMEDDLDYQDPSVPCCSICLEPYRVGSVVAWSRETYMNNNASNGGDREQSPCVHVFHRDCIVPWLENPSHDDCPSCRTILLKPNWDEDNEGIVDDNENEDRERTGLKRFLHRTISRIRQGHRDESEHNVEDEEQAPDTCSSTGHSTSGMIFEIVHGLVSRVHRASCNLIGQDIPVPPPPPPTRAVDAHATEPKLSDDTIVAAPTFSNSFSSSDSGEEEDANMKGDLFLSCEDSVLWKELCYNETISDHGKEDGTAES